MHRLCQDEQRHHEEPDEILHRLPQILLECVLHIFVQIKVVEHPLQIPHILTTDLFNISVLVLTELEGLDKYGRLGQLRHLLHRIDTGELLLCQLHELGEQQFEYQHITDGIMGFDGDPPFLCLRLFLFVEPQCIAKVLQPVVGLVWQQMTSDTHGIDQRVAVVKALFLQHTQIEADIVGDEIVLGVVVLLYRRGKFRFTERGSALKALRSDIVYLHRFDRDGHRRGAELVIDLDVLSVMHDHRAALDNAVILLIACGLGVEKYVDSHKNPLANHTQFQPKSPNFKLQWYNCTICSGRDTRRGMLKKHYTSVISEIFGKFASKRFPALIQHLINASYVKLMGLDMSEFRPPASYESLNALFTRALEQERMLPSEKEVLISGVDALVTDYGKIVSDRAYQIKGMSYSIVELFGEYHRAAAEWVEGGEFMNFYLSPKDYHRYHMPFTLKIHSLTHIPGKLYPVNFPLLRNKRNLFIENERVVIECEDEKGRMHVLVLVGALNVGKMAITFEPRVQTNSEIREPQHYTYEDLTLERGALLGWFEMGSTLLHFVQKGAIVPNIAVNQKVRYGEKIGIVQ